MIQISANTEFAVNFQDHNDRQNKGQHIRRREGVEDAVQTEEARQQDRQKDAEKDLSYQRQHHRRAGLAQRLQIDKGPLVDHGQHHHTEIDAEAADSEGCIVGALVACAENADQLTRQKLHDQQGDKADSSFPSQQHGKQTFCPILAPGTNIVTDHGDAASRKADRNRDGDLEKLHDDAQHRQRDLRIFRLPEHRVQRTVFGDHVLHRGHGDDKRDLAEEAGDAQEQEAPDQLAL